MFIYLPLLIFNFVAFFLVVPCVPAVFAEEIGKTAEFFFEQTTENYCILPPPPKNGSYTIVDGDRTAQPGCHMQRYALEVACDPGFQLVGDRSPSCLEGLEVEMPECLSQCHWENTFTVSCGEQLTCYFMQRGAPAPDLPHHADDDECGIVTPSHVNVVSGGKPSRMYELPWHAGVYSKLFRPYKQMCGGTLVSSSVVISAAHCFWSETEHQLPAEHYAVALGKIYRPWNDKHDKNAQKSDVREIHIPPRYFGGDNRFQEDLALLVLASAVTFTGAVRPVCLDFDHSFDLHQLTSGAMGKIGGWGLTAEDGHESPTLQVAYLPFIDIKECVAGALPAFREYITSDKICAGYTNGTAVCKGDSGGGLVFPHFARETRYYLRGVVSTAPGSEHKCNVFHWATFTHVQRHQHYIQDVMSSKL